MLADRIKALQYQASENGLVHKIYFYISASPGDGKGRVAIYDQAGVNLPGTLLAASPEQALTLGWNSFDLSMPITIQAGAIYWLSVQIQGSGQIETLSFNDANANLMQSAALPYGAFPNVFPLPSIANNFRVPFYATDEGLAPTPTHTSVVIVTWQPIGLSLVLSKNSFTPGAGNFLRIGYGGEAIRELTLYAVSGEKQRVWSLQGGPSMGMLDWDGCDGAGNAVASGLYLFELRSAQARIIKKIIVLR
jgi:hypothetical protein